MNTIKSKWKHFALDFCLSSYDEKLDGEKLFDSLMDCHDHRDALCQLFDDADICVWQQFEDMTLSDLVGTIWDLAENAQATEALEEPLL